jgi:protein CpxP
MLAAKTRRRGRRAQQTDQIERAGEIAWAHGSGFMRPSKSSMAWSRSLMKPTVQRIVVAGVLCLGLAASAAAAQDRPAGPGGPSAAGAPDPGARGPRGGDRQKLFAEMQHRREQRLHDLLQIKPDQETAFRTFVAALEQARPQRGLDGARGPGAAAQAPLTAPERLDRMTQRMAERTAERQQRLQKVTAAVKTFYGALTPEQRKAFDELPLLKVGGDGRHGDGHWGGRMMRGRFQGPPPGPIG